MNIINLVIKSNLILYSTKNIKSLFVNSTPSSSTESNNFTILKFIEFCNDLNNKENIKNITRLEIRNENLIKLPDQIHLFKNLQILFLDNNSFTKIPYDLKDLTYLSMSYNKIEKIELEINEMSNLNYLNLNSNKIKILPSTLKLLKKLTDLRLSSNPLTNLSEFPNSLVYLHLDDSKLKILPDYICNLVNLKELFLNSNLLSSLPKSFCNLKFLEKLNLENNLFKEIPDQVYNLKKIKFLILDNNNIGKICNKIINLDNLNILGLKECQLNDLPEEICQLKNLKNLCINKNNITKLPENISNLKNLEFFYCNKNKIKELPESIGYLTNLTLFDCSFNDLSEIKSSIGNLNKVENIYLSNNNIKNLPNSINKLNNLDRFGLNNNKLKEFPDNCENLINLTELILSNNLITNFSTVCKIKNLKILNLDSNRISDIPKNICNLEKIEYLDLSNNKISFLPKELSKCLKLKNLILNNNKIKRIPIELIEVLRNLKSINLRQNPLEIYGNSTELGLNELIKELGFKVLVDDISVEKVYNFLNAKPINFNFENLRKCRITSLPVHICSEQDLLNKIKNCNIIKSNNMQTSDGNVVSRRVRPIDTKFLVEYIKDLYNPNSSCIPFNVRINHLELFKRLISAIVTILFSSNDAVFIKEHYDRFLKAREYGFERHKAELIYLYEILVVKDSQNLASVLQNNQNSKQEGNEINLKTYIENNFKLFIGKVKMRVFIKTFLSSDESKNIQSYEYWKNLLKEQIGIDVYGQKSVFCGKDLFNGREELGLIGFFKEFTPELLINELYEFIHNDNSFLCKVIEFIEKSEIENKFEFFECVENDLNFIVGVKKEFCEFILKKMQIINFN